MFVMTVARDIESCSRCPMLIFPGDEVYLGDEGMLHESHMSTLAVA